MRPLNRLFVGLIAAYTLTACPPTDDPTDPTSDADGDGYPADTDCNDNDPHIHPKAAEVCDGLDNNCDERIDEASAVGATTWYADTDGDSYGDAAVSKAACSQPSGYVSDHTDCDDTKATVNPAAAEICDGLDDDCNAATDDASAVDVTTWYADTDGDSYGAPAVSKQACIQPSGYVSRGDDCDDTKPTVYPGGAELCDGLDNDCNNKKDEGVLTSTYYADTDGDGFGDAAVTKTACSKPDGYVADKNDCADTDVKEPQVVGANTGAADGTRAKPWPTITQGIATATKCVAVLAGNYKENVDFAGKNVDVFSTAGLATTTITGTGTGSVVTFADGEGLGAKLRGFTITGGGGTLETTTTTEPMCPVAPGGPAGPAGPAAAPAAPSGPSAPGYGIEKFTDPALNDPRGLALDAAGNAYTFAHLEGKVFKLAAGASALTQIASLGAETWVGIAYDASANTLYFDKYVAGQIVALHLSDASQTTAFTGLVSEGTGGIASDGHGKLYVTQWAGASSNCPADVLKIDVTAAPPTKTTYVSQQVCYPDGPAVAADGTVYVAERGSRVIRRIDAVTQAASVLIDNFTAPYNVSVTPKGDLLVPDGGTGTIYRIDPANPQKNVLGTGFGEVYTAVEDANGRIYVASMDLDAIYRLTPTVTDPCAGAQNGTACNDGNACTLTDTCQAGVCVGANPDLTTMYHRYYGGGIYIDGAAPTLSDLKVVGNALPDYAYVANEATHTYTYTYSYGGGLFMTDSIGASIWRVTFDSNFADEGGGVYASDSAVVSMDQVAFVSNVAGADGGGAGYYVSGGTLDLTNAIVRDNQGGGAWVDGGSSTWWNVTAFRNDGDGVDVRSGGSFYLYSSSITKSTGEGVSVETGSTFSSEYSNCYGDDGGNGGFASGSSGNISADPGFVSTSFDAPDLHLAPGSELIDAGNPSAAYSDTDGTANDIGAYGGPGGAW